MTRFFLGLAGLAVAASPVVADAKSSLEGRWKNGSMQIQIAQCGPSLCGTVVKASAKQQARAQRGSGTSLLGARVISNIRTVAPQRYRANVYLADRDVTASGTIRQLGPNRLEVRGCMLAVICKTTHWDRIG